MNNDYVAEILRATGSLRSGDPAAVNAIIQNALAAAGLTGSVGVGPSANANFGIQLPQSVPAAGHGADLRPPRADRLRKPLSEVLNTLRSGGMGLGLEGLPGLGRPAHAPELPLPDGAQFLDLRYSCAAGTRRYRLYVPSTAGETLHVKVVGLVRIASDVPPELALQTIGSLTVLGALQASPAIKAALAARIK